MINRDDKLLCNKITTRSNSEMPLGEHLRKIIGTNSTSHHHDLTATKLKIAWTIETKVCSNHHLPKDEKLIHLK